MGRSNTSSIDTEDGLKIAIQGAQRKKNEQENFNLNNSGESKPVNAKKKENMAAQKAKAKKRAKIAKASRRKNKK